MSRQVTHFMQDFQLVALEPTIRRDLPFIFEEGATQQKTL